MRAKFVIVLALASALLGLPACQAASTKASQSHTLRIGSLEGVDSPNPLVGDSTDTRAAYGYMYPKLTQYAKDGSNIVGDFATRWESSADAKTWTFDTRSGAKWSDGAPMSAEDAAWWFDTVLKYKDGATGFFAVLLPALASAEAPNSTTLVLKFSQPMGNVPALMTTVSILPKHVWSKHVGTNGQGLKTFNNVPSVSGGPFIMTKFAREDIALFKENPNYYGPKPHITSFGVQFFSNADALLAALKQHQIDMADVPATLLEPAKADKGLSVQQTAGFKIDWIWVNSNSKSKQAKALADPTLRRAMSMAIDRGRIVHDLFDGAAEPASTYIAPAVGPYHAAANIATDPYDPAAANRLLDQAGYKLGKDGVRTGPFGRLAFSMFTNQTGNPQMNRQFQIIQAGFKAIGIELTQLPRDPSGMFSQMAEPNGQYLNWQLAMLSSVTTADPGYFSVLFRCDSFASAGGANYMGFCDPKWDQLDNQQLAQSGQARVNTIAQMQQIIYKTAPVIPIDYRNVIEVWAKGWKGYHLAPEGSFNERSKWTLEDVQSSAAAGS